MNYRPVMYDYTNRRALIVVRRPGKVLCAKLIWMPFHALWLMGLEPQWVKP